MESTFYFICILSSSHSVFKSERTGTGHNQFVQIILEVSQYRLCAYVEIVAAVVVYAQDFGNVPFRPVSN